MMPKYLFGTRPNLSVSNPSIARTTPPDERANELMPVLALVQSWPTVMPVMLIKSRHDRIFIFFKSMRSLMRT